MYVIKKAIPVVLFAASLLMSGEVLATSAISQQAKDLGVDVSKGCLTCHTGADGSSSNIKPGYQAAYKKDTAKLTALIALINGVTPPPTCTPPQVLQNGACVTPPPTPTLPNACDETANIAVCLNSAHQYGSLGSAESGAARTDVYKVKCPKKTKTIAVSVMDMAPDNPAKISIQASQGSGSTPLSTDKVDGDSGYSRTVKLAKGPGTYLVKINKSKSSTPGVELYDAQIVCIGDKKKQILSTTRIKQNQ